MLTQEVTPALPPYGAAWITADLRLSKDDAASALYRVVLPQGSRIRVCGPILGMVTETSGLPDPLTEPAEDETSAQTAGVF
jgi:hypothetical protein